MEFVMDLADLHFAVTYRHPDTLSRCRDYQISAHAADPAPIAVCCDKEQYCRDMRAFAAQFPQPLTDSDRTKVHAYCEFIGIYRAICSRVLDYDGFMLHSAAVVLDGQAYLFCAPAGIGKTTHAKLWCEKFGKRAYILNGDKPLIRRVGGQWTVYGTPWCGKEGKQRNASAPLSGICFLKRGKNDRTYTPTADEWIGLLLRQIYFPKKCDAPERLMILLNDMMRATPAVCLEATPAQSAVCASAAAFGIICNGSSRCRAQQQKGETIHEN